MEWREVDVPELLVGDVGFFVVAAADRCAVAGEVLDGGEDVAGRAELLALESADLCGGHFGAEVGIFAGALHDASPAGVAGDIDHGAECPLDAGG